MGKPLCAGPSGKGKCFPLLKGEFQRPYYNGAVRNLNVEVQSFPSSIVAGVGGFATRDFFELADTSDRNAPQVQFNPAPT